MEPAPSAPQRRPSTQGHPSDKLQATSTHTPRSSSFSTGRLENKLAEYVVLVNSKLQMMAWAAEANPFDSSYFMFMDAGCAGGGKKVQLAVFRGGCRGVGIWSRLGGPCGGRPAGRPGGARARGAAPRVWKRPRGGGGRRRSCACTRPLAWQQRCRPETKQTGGTRRRHAGSPGGLAPSHRRRASGSPSPTWTRCRFHMNSHLDICMHTRTCISASIWTACSPCATRH